MTQTQFRYYNGFAKPEADNEILVVGSNLRGAHGAGAALFAKRHYGAKTGVGEGLSGHTYLLPAKDYYIKTLPLDIIVNHVNVFSDFTFIRPDLIFYVTPVGTGLAGYKNSDMAPLFRYCNKNNCIMPEPWRPHLS